MNKKDYKAIAEIIKRTTLTITSEYGSEKYLKLNFIVNRLANYFENRKREKINFIGFNREQFLKDCGVEK